MMPAIERRYYVLHLPASGQGALRQSQSVRVGGSTYYVSSITGRGDGWVTATLAEQQNTLSGTL